MEYIISTKEGYLPIEFNVEWNGESLTPIEITFECRPIELTQKQLDSLLDYIDENQDKIIYNENDRLI